MIAQFRNSCIVRDLIHAQFILINTQLFSENYNFFRKEPLGYVCGQT